MDLDAADIYMGLLYANESALPVLLSLSGSRLNFFLHLRITCASSLSGAALGVFLGMQVNTHDFCKTILIITKY